MVSVIIPNYNHAQYLKQRIDSVLDQTFRDIEVIILDDCSTDNSKEIIEAYRNHPKVKHILYNRQNSGCTFIQWNRGFKLAKGEYIWIAESDDYNAPLFLEGLVQLFAANEKLGIAYCQSYRVNENGEITGDWLNHTGDLDKERWNSPYVSEGHHEIKNYLAYKNIIPNASGMLLKKECLEAAGYADETCILNGDWLFYIKILSKGYSIAYTHEKLNYFREHSVKVTRKAVLKGYNILEVFIILRFIMSLRFLNQTEASRILNFYFDHYLPQLFRRSVSVPVKGKTVVTAFAIAPARTVRSLIKLV